MTDIEHGTTYSRQICSVGKNTLIMGRHPPIWRSERFSTHLQMKSEFGVICLCAERCVSVGEALGLHKNG